MSSFRRACMVLLAVGLLGGLSVWQSVRAQKAIAVAMPAPPGPGPVIGRWCPWEIAHYAGRADWRRVSVRFARRMMPVRMNAHTVWTRYWTPMELYRTFAEEFALVQYRALCLFAPPPYMTSLRDRHPAWFERLWRWDRYAGGWPLLRSLGDHFLIVMARR